MTIKIRDNKEMKKIENNRGRERQTHFEMESDKLEKFVKMRCKKGESFEISVK